MKKKMREHTRITIVKEFWDAYNAKDVDGMVALWAENLRYVGSPGERYDKEAFRCILLNNDVGFPDRNVSIVRTIAQGDTIVTESRWSATLTGTYLGTPPTTRRVEITVVDIFDLHEGKNQALNDYGNMPALEQQIQGKDE